MEQPEPTTQATDAEATAPPSPEVSASERPEATPPNGGAPRMDAFIRGVAAGPAPSTSKRDDGDDDAANAEDTDGEPTPNGAAEPAGTPGGKVGRRRAPAEIARLSEENARLQKALEELQPPPPPDASEEAKAKALANEQRFRGLILKPDDEISGDDYNWREDEKKKRDLVPEVVAHYEAVFEAERAAAQAAAEQDLAGRWKAIGDDLKTTLGYPGVDDTVKESLLKAPLSQQILTHRRLERQITEAEKDAVISGKDAKISQLERDLKAARLDGLGSARAPVGAGNSGGGKSVSIDNWIRGRL